MEGVEEADRLGGGFWDAGGDRQVVVVDGLTAGDLLGGIGVGEVGGCEE